MNTVPYTEFFKTPYNEFYDSIAVGGQQTIWRSGSDYYMSHTFTSGSNLSTGLVVYTSSIQAEVLVVAGGGGGGFSGNSFSYSGGGGAGGLLYTSSITLYTGVYTTTIGAGGQTGSNGGNSSLLSISGSSIQFYATGGGYGGTAAGGPPSQPGQPGGNGGSGGGGVGSFGSGVNPGGTGSQGQNGGSGLDIYGGGGGGGGAATTGSDGGPGSGDSYGGNGGNGNAYVLQTGISTYYAGGGGGGGGDNGAQDAPGIGGLGGGANGGSTGSNNLGGGGGGSLGDQAGNRKGGSGIVIITHKLPVTKILTGSVSPYTSSFTTSSLAAPGLFVFGVYGTVNSTGSVYLTKLNLSDGKVDTSFSSGLSQGSVSTGIYTAYAYNNAIFSYSGHSAIQSKKQNFSGSIDYSFFPTGALGYASLAGYNNYQIDKSVSLYSGSFNDTNAQVFAYGEWGSYAASDMAIPNNPHLIKVGFTLNNLDFNYTSNVSSSGAIGTTKLGWLIQQNDYKVITSNLKRFNTNGTIDTTYNTGSYLGGGTGAGYIFGENNFDYSTNKLYIAYSGSYTTYSGSAISGGLIRLNSSGGLDTTFVASGSGFSTRPIYMVVQSDGKILMLYSTANGSPNNTFGSGTYNGTPFSGSLRLNSDATIDTTWSGSQIGDWGGTPSQDYNYGIIQAQEYSGSIYIMTAGWNQNNKLYKYNMSGSIDGTWTQSTITGANPGAFGAQPYFNGFSIG